MFLEYFDFQKKTGEPIYVSHIIEVFNKHEIDLHNSHDLCCDNGSNMSGKIKGLQVKIRKINPLATFNSCAAQKVTK